MGGIPPSEGKVTTGRPLRLTSMRGSLLLVVLSGMALAQDTAAPPSFDVAVVKPNKTGEPFAERAVVSGRRIFLENNTLKDLTAEAWGMRKDQIVDGPAWFDSDRFDVTGQTAPDTPEATRRVMLQSLLAERFKLAVHKDERALPVFALVLAKSGPKLTPATGSARRFCEGLPVAGGQLHRACNNMTMAALASEWLEKMSPLDFDLPVLDLTGLTGAYDFKVNWSPSANAPGRSGAFDPNGSTIFEALRQVGLNLERRKVPAPVIVIDRVERVPTAN
jgi:uncharacterized protein (TIGR03435 family)